MIGGRLLGVQEALLCFDLCLTGKFLCFENQSKQEILDYGILQSHIISSSMRKEIIGSMNEIASSLAKNDIFFG